MPLVPNPKKAGIVWFIIIASLVLTAVIGIYIPMDRKVIGVCHLTPSVQWTLSERRVGSYESKASDLCDGRILSYKLYQFDRPTCLDIELGKLKFDELGGIPVQAGQTVVRMRSSELELELAERGTALAEAQSRLSTLRGGAKPEEIERAELALARGTAELDAFQVQFERQKQLFIDGVISSTVWEETRTHQLLLSVDRELAGAELEVLASDAKPEVIAAWEATISSLQTELNMVEEMFSAQDIHTPISGTLHINPAKDFLLSVIDTDTMVVKILVPQHQSYLVQVGQELGISIPGVKANDLTGRVIRLDVAAVNTRAGTFITAYGLVENARGLLTEGMQGRSRISCGETTVTRRIVGILLDTIQREFWIQ
jgi:hypothetical protein